MLEGERNKAEYKSAIRSRKLIRMAYVELLQEKDINKITVTDVVKRADINRGTFYAHYQNTHSVQEQIENELIDQLLTLLKEFRYENFIQNPLPLLQKASHYLEQDLDFYRQLAKSKNSYPFLNKLKEILINYIMNHTELPESQEERDTFQTAINFYIGGIVMLYLDWFHDKLNLPLNDITQKISQLIVNGYKLTSHSML